MEGVCFRMCYVVEGVLGRVAGGKAQAS
jgi:hypothetical protein